MIPQHLIDNCSNSSPPACNGIWELSGGFALCVNAIPGIGLVCTEDTYIARISCGCMENGMGGCAPTYIWNILTINACDGTLWN
jgi:hypothetical protein